MNSQNFAHGKEAHEKVSSFIGKLPTNTPARRRCAPDRQHWEGGGGPAPSAAAVRRIRADTGGTTPRARGPLLGVRTGGARPARSQQLSAPSSVRARRLQTRSVHAGQMVLQPAGVRDRRLRASQTRGPRRRRAESHRTPANGCACWRLRAGSAGEHRPVDSGREPATRCLGTGDCKGQGEAWVSVFTCSRFS